MSIIKGFPSLPIGPAVDVWRFARRALLALGLLATVCPPAALGATESEDAPTDRKVRVNVDPRVELMSVIFRLAGNPEYNQGRVESYVADVEQHFGPHRSHPAVTLARELRNNNGVSYDACMSMAVHLTDVPSLGEAVPFDPHPETLDGRWTVDHARQFVTLARDFVKVTDFQSFIDAHQPLYDQSVKRMRRLLDKRGHLEWFDRFFGTRPGAEFTVILGMLNGPQCYGPRIKVARDAEKLYCVLGVWQTDKRGRPKFDRSMLGTVVHEFCHSYVNPIIDGHESEFAASARQIYPQVEAAMKRQAYGTWQTMMKESLVRACVVRYKFAHESQRKATQAISEEKERQFFWVGELADLLGEYEAQRDRFKTLEDLVPRMVRFFDEYGPRFASRKQPQTSKAPQVVSITPANGSRGVSASLKRIKVVFDRPMKNRSWSVVGGGPHFPNLKGQPSYDAARKVLTLRVRLKPDWAYEFWLNSNRFKNFVSADGTPLEPVHVTFSTGPAD